jgi:RNA polymerase-binding protein DksA
MTKEQLDLYNELLVERRNLILGDVNSLADQAKRGSDDLSHLPIHLADAGTDTFDQDLALGMVENGEDEIREIDDAIERIRAGTYGTCESCSASIPEARLQAIPYARLCLDCKQKEEEEGTA